MNVKSEGSYWVVGDALVSRSQVAKKELMILHRKAKVPAGTVLRMSASGLICFSCPSETGCAHRDALEERIALKLESFDTPLEDVPGLRFNQMAESQEMNIKCRMVMKTTPSEAMLSGTADKVHPTHKVRLLTGPLPGGPYSQLVTEVKGNDSLGQPITGTIKDLAPNSEYYYIVQVVNERGEVLMESEEQKFKTQSHGPRVVRSKNVKNTSAVIEGTANLVGSKQFLQLAYWEDGKKEAVALTTPGHNNAGQIISATLTGLKPKTTYFFNVQVVSNGHVVEESTEWWFETSDYVVEAEPVELVLSSTATIKGNVDWIPESQSVVLIYGTADETFTVPGTWTGTDTKGQKIVARLTELAPDTEYWFQVQVLHGNKIIRESKKTSFKTFAHNPEILSVDAKAGTVIITGAVDYVDEIEDIQVTLAGKVVGSVPGRGIKGQQFQVYLDELKANHNYKYSLDVARHGKIVSQATGEFNTQGYQPDVIGTLNVKDRQATLMGAADFLPPTKFARFAWGTKSGVYNGYSQLMFGSNQEAQSFGFLAYGLEPNTEYYYRLELIGSDGTMILESSQESTFQTAEQTRMRKRS